MGGYSDDLLKRLSGRGATAALLAHAPRLAPRKLNVYQCQICLGLVCTVDRDQGTTPFMIDCRVTSGCKGSMQSSFYIAHPMLQPTLEWYRPTADDPLLTKPGVADHVARGGLLLRSIAKPQGRG